MRFIRIRRETRIPSELLRMERIGQCQRYREGLAILPRHPMQKIENALNVLMYYVNLFPRRRERRTGPPKPVKHDFPPHRRDFALEPVGGTRGPSRCAACSSGKAGSRVAITPSEAERSPLILGHPLFALQTLLPIMQQSFAPIALAIRLRRSVGLSRYVTEGYAVAPLSNAQ